MAVLKTEGGERRGLSGRAARKMVLIEGEPFGPGLMGVESLTRRADLSKI